MIRCRVVVVGAGPGGAVTTLHLARAGVDVVVIDKATLPRAKVCGGGVVKRALRHVPADVVLPVERACRRVSMRMFDGNFAHVVVRAEAVVSMTMRADLDLALVDAAVKSGAHVLAPCAVIAIERSVEHVDVVTAAGLVRADFVVVADGATGPCARLAGFDDTLATIPALEAEVRVDARTLEAHADTAAFDFGGVVSGGYGWVFGKRDHLSCGVLSMKRGSVHLRDRLDRYLHAVGIVEPLAIETRGYVIPIRPRKRLARDRVLLVGDAAGLADPVTAEGISLAMHSGAIAAQSIVEHTTARDVERTFERRIQQEIKADLRVARLLSRLLYDKPRLARRLFERRGQSLCEAMTSVTAGERSYRSLLSNPLNWSRLVLGR